MTSVLHPVKRRRVAYASAPLALLIAAVPAQGFEGEIQNRQVRADINAIQRVVPGAGPGDQHRVAAVTPDRFVADGGDGIRVDTSVLIVKGSWARTNMEDAGMPGFMLMNFDQGAAYMCRSDQRQCMRFSQEDREEAAAQADRINDAIREAMKGHDLTPEQQAHLPGALRQPQAGAEADPVTITDEGRDEEVAGVAAHVYKASSGTDVAFAWTTSELPEIATVYARALELFERSGRDAGFAGRARKAMGDKGLPLRVQVVESRRGAPVYRSNEITGYTAKAVDDAYVQPPAGWKIQSRDEMMAEAARGAHPGGGAPKGMPPGAPPPVQLPPGVKLPPGVQLPPGVVPPAQ